MGWKGRHQRNYIFVDTGCNQDGLFEAGLLHEEPCEIYGMFGVVHADYTNNFYVIWRPNRNHTQYYDIKVMSDSDRYGVTRTYDSLEEAVDSITYWLANFEPPAKHKRYRPRDAQQNKVYLWEHVMATEIGPKEVDNGDIYSKLERRRSREYLQKYLVKVCNELGEKIPELKFRTGGSSSYAGVGSDADIRLIKAHCTRTVLLHELAHILHNRWGNKTDGKRHQSHGREFVGIFAYLYIRFGGIDKSAIVRHAAKSKVKLLLPDQYWVWNESRKAA